MHPSGKEKRSEAGTRFPAEEAVWETLRAVIEDISGELMLRPLLTRIVIHACQLIGADNGTIGLLDRRRDLIRTEAAYRMPPSELGAEMPRGIGLAGEVLQSGQTVVLERYGEVRHPTQPELAANAVVGVPILWQGEVIGVFGIGGSPGGKEHFNDADVELLSLFARHAAIAIINAQRYEREQKARQETQLLFDTSARMTATRDATEVVTAYLEQVARGGKFACNITEYVWETPGKADPDWVRVLGVWTPDGGLNLTRRQHPYVRDLLDDLLDTNQTVTISDVHTDRRVNATLREIQRASGRPALALIPLRGRGEHRLGHVILSAPEVHEWTEEELRRFQITAAQLAATLDSRRQQEIMTQRQQQLAIYEERRRLARDLHDAVTQMLFSLHLIAQSIPPVLKRNPAEAERRLERVVELSHASLAEMRALLKELQPTDAESGEVPDGSRALTARLRRDGLSAILAAYVAQVNDAQAALPGRRPRVSLENSGYQGGLDDAQEEALLRIAQEAIANAIKHSGCRKIRVSLRGDAGEIRLIVQDDGKGFDPSTVNSEEASAGQLHSGGMGLSGMHTRAQAIGATFDLETAPGQGTLVTVLMGIKNNRGILETVRH